MSLPMPDRPVAPEHASNGTSRAVAIDTAQSMAVAPPERAARAKKLIGGMPKEG